MDQKTENNIRIQNNWFKNIYSHLLDHSQNLERVSMSIKMRMDKRIVTINNKKEQTSSTYNNMDEPQNMLSDLIKEIICRMILFVESPRKNKANL